MEWQHGEEESTWSIGSTCMAGRVGLEDVCDLSSAWVEIVQMQYKVTRLKQEQCVRTK